MSDTPFTVAFRDKHGDVRWRRCRLTILRAGKGVMTGDDNGVVINHDGMRILIEFLLPWVSLSLRQLFLLGLGSRARTRCGLVPNIDHDVGHLL